MKEEKRKEKKNIYNKHTTHTNFFRIWNFNIHVKSIILLFLFDFFFLLENFLKRKFHKMKDHYTMYFSLSLLNTNLL